MVAKSKVLTAKQLQITPRERKYLIQSEKILAKQEPGQIVQIKDDGSFRFHMGTAGRRLLVGEECGTEGCIAGLAHLLCITQEGKPLFAACQGGTISGASDNLFKLFFPDRTGFLQSTKPKQAAFGIRHFLQTGKHLSLEEWKTGEAKNAL